MKKSEAVEKIIKLMAESGYIRTDDKNVEAFLNAAECIGMLPPGKTMTYLEFENIRKYNVTPYTSVHVWEYESFSGKLPC